jgi:2-oxo-4-hydroxy-4-carboxy-5-ureidoimidazoline decarboxylase
MVNQVRISLAELNYLDRTSFVSHIGWIYEHSPWVAEAAWEERPFETLNDLQAAMDAVVRDAPADQCLDLLRAHPDLAGRLAQAAELTPASKEEQSKAGLTHLLPEQLVEIQQLNGAYFKKFEFPFIVCARLSKLETILGGLRRRMNNDRESEIRAAMSEISKIAHLRLLDAVVE